MSTETTPPDVNVWLARFVASHSYHAPAQRWPAQPGFLRLVTSDRGLAGFRGTNGLELKGTR